MYRVRIHGYLDFGQGVRHNRILYNEECFGLNEWLKENCEEKTEIYDDNCTVDFKNSDDLNLFKLIWGNDYNIVRSKVAHATV